MMLVDDAIKFLASNAAAIEKTDSDKMVVVNEKDRSHEKPQLSETTNSVF
jgi:hypothetical protein